MTIGEPARPDSPSQIHIEMLRRFPELGEDFGIEAVLGAYGYWTWKQAAAGHRERVAASLGCVEKLVTVCPPNLALQAVVSMFDGVGWPLDVGEWIGPHTRALLETQDWWS